MKKTAYIKLITLTILATLATTLLLFFGCKPEEVQPEPFPEYFTVTYSADEGGRISGNESQEVAFGENGVSVYAEAEEGYKFVQWSDGVTTAERREQNVISDISVTAIFNKLRFTVEYLTDGNGSISGRKKQQQIEYGNDASTVSAEPNEGYRFVKWSDDNKNRIRRDKNVTSDLSFTAIFERIILSVQYNAGKNGIIEGKTQQSIAYGENSETVTAIPDEGYKFVKWSDGLESATRNEKNLNANKKLTAEFEIITKTYKYNYKFADKNCEKENISISYGQFENVKFVVPEREHGKFAGWYADEFLMQQVSDGEGNTLIGDDLYYSDCTQLYAKWTTENFNQFKLLIIYVTELHAELTTRDEKNKIQVDYVMTDLERRLCHMTTEKLSFELNDLAVADFCVDEYFTTEPLTKENMIELHVYTGDGLDNGIFPYNIPEASHLLDQYDSVLVSFSMNDYDNNLSNQVGVAVAKYGYVHFDDNLGQLLLYNEKIESLLEPTHYYWNQALDVYMHELAHTIELRMNNFFDFHKVVSEYSRGTRDKLLADKLYFLNRAVINGETVGVPYEFWEGKVAKVHYDAQTGGYVTYIKQHHNPIHNQPYNDDIQYVLYGEDAISVIAKPFNGYEFAGWSDGVETAERTDRDINGDLLVYAYFKPINS